MRHLRQSLPAFLSFIVLGCPREPPPPSWFGSTSVPGAGATSLAPPAPAKLTGPFVSCEKTPLNELVRIDQFGYRPGAKKLAVLSDPVEGFDSKLELKPGKRYEVRSWSDGKVAHAGSPEPWNEGALQRSSGDRGSWYDFSSLTTPGDYCVLDVAGGFRSHRFSVGSGVYRDVLRAATKVFYFQRANVAKQKPFACAGEKCWVVAADYVGAGQDREARSVRDRGNAATARDLSGGWWDAGDVNKYVTFAQTPVHQLLTAYTERPQVFGDDFGIPESGNRVPDLLDELKVELDWLMKMQPSDASGGVLLKVGNVDFGDPVPEKSRFPRYYYPQPCSSSTIAAAGMFAHAALVMKTVPSLATYASDLQARARRAWTHFHQHPKSGDCDDGTIKAGDADRSLVSQEQASVVAAVYLFALTGEASYGEAIMKGARSLRPMTEDGWSSYEPEQGEALLYYAALPNADPSLKATILARKLEQARSLDIYGYKPALDLYGAFMRDGTYHWGHNQVRANVGNTNYELTQLASSLKPSELESFQQRAEGVLHWFHGVNPLGLVYLTNMYAFGAERSVNQIFHVWFPDGDPTYDDARSSRLGPAPGYLPGGPSRQYCEGQDPAKNKCASSLLRRQPLQKAYLDFNTAWNPEVEHDRSWEVTEPGIYYQSAYVMLASKFVD